MKYFNTEAITQLKRDTKVSTTGVTHGFVKDLFKSGVYDELMATFPDIQKFKFIDKQSGGGNKRFWVGPLYSSARDFGSAYHLRGLSPVWKGVIDEMQSEPFITALADATHVQFNSLDHFGFSYGKEGNRQGAHIDGAALPTDTSVIKGTIALLMYFNKADDPVSATELYDLDKTTVIAKGTTLRNSLFFFGQHPNAWHGYPPCPPGHERFLVSLGYSTEKSPIRLHWDFLHKILPLEKWKWQKAKSQ